MTGAAPMASDVNGAGWLGRVRALAMRRPVRPDRSVVWYGAYTLVLFLVCLVAVFPYDLALERALRTATARAPVRVETGPSRLGWTLAYLVDSLRVVLPEDASEPLLAAESLRLTPSRLGVLWGNPYPVGLDAALYGGRIAATLDPRPASFRVDAALSGIDLARYGGVRPWLDGSLRGRLEGTLALDGGGRGPAAATGTIALRVPGLALEGGKIRGITVPDLHFTDVRLQGTVKNGRLEIDELVADGSEIGLRGEGHVLVRATPAASLLALDLVVTPAAGAPDGLKLALGMLPGTAGENGARRMAIGGTIGRPTVR